MHYIPAYFIALFDWFYHWKDWCWSWYSSTLASSCEELTHCKRPWCWDGLGAGGEGEDRGWDGWMASLTWWTCVWVNSGSWWWIGRPGMLRFMGSQRVGHDWVTELNWSLWSQLFLCWIFFIFHIYHLLVTLISLPFSSAFMLINWSLYYYIDFFFYCFYFESEMVTLVS